jgi:sodium-dependent dicarboxylate transporter 2/3/5
MLDRIGALLNTWEAAKQTRWYRLVGVALAVAVLLVGRFAPAPAGLSSTGWLAASITAVMALLWVGEVVPMAITSLLPVVLFPAFGLATVRGTAANYMDPMILLMLGGFVLGHAMEAVGLHRRLAAAVLSPAFVRSSPRRVLFAVMATTAALSALMSNTATALMMMPLAASIADSARIEGRQRTAFPLGVAYAASIGGCATLIGTPPNAVLAGLAAKLVHHPISFASWMIAGVPFVILALPAAWWAVGRVVIPLPATTERPIEPPPTSPWDSTQAAVALVVGGALIAWVTRAPIALGAVRIPGWSEWLSLDVDDGWVAVALTCALFLLPARPQDRHKFLLRWSEVERAIPWGVLLLLGGGFALAEVIGKTGLTEWLAGYCTRLADLPVAAATLVLCFGMVAFTEFVSNTAATQVAIPLLAAAATQAHVAPLTWMVPATLAASCGFMMPAGTAPNAIATEGGGVRPADMVFAGFFVNLWCGAVAALTAAFAAPWM